MICPDCEQEVDKLIISTGTCKKCYCRMQNLKYHKQEYVPIKNLKETDPSTYNRLMKRRTNDKPANKVQRQPIVKVPYKPKENKAKEYIESKIVEILKANDLDIGLVDIQSVKLTLELMKDLFYNFDDKKDKFAKAIGLIDLLKCDVQHEIENCDIENTELYQFVNDKNYYLLKKRRLYKNSHDILDKLSNMAFTMNSIAGFNAMLDDNLKMITDLKEAQENPKYNVKIDDGMLKYDFTREDPRRRFQVKTNLTGLYNQRKAQEFTRNVLAFSPDDAKNMVRQFILDRFKNVKIGELKVEELTVTDDKN